MSKVPCHYILACFVCAFGLVCICTCLCVCKCMCGMRVCMCTRVCMGVYLFVFVYTSGLACGCVYVLTNLMSVGVIR